MELVNKAKQYVKKFREYLVNESQGWYTQPWYTVRDRGTYMIGSQEEDGQRRNMKQYTGGRYPGIPNFYGPEVPLPPELREKMTAHRQASKAQTEKNYKHPEYCVCPSCKREHLATAATDPRWVNVDLSPEYYGAGSKITEFKPYYGPMGVSGKLPRYTTLFGY